MDREATAAISLTVEEVAHLKRAMTPQRDYADRVSLVLLWRIYAVVPDDALSIFDEIEFLEGRKSCTGTKAAKSFKHAPLNRFWHKHFSSPRHMARNVGERWGVYDGGNRDLISLISRVMKEHGNSPNLWAGRLAHEFVLGGYEARSRDRLTGDWIIFAKWHGKNYYLDLATHEEGKDGDALYRKLKAGCEAEFPFLFT